MVLPAVTISKQCCLQCNGVSILTWLKVLKRESLIALGFLQKGGLSLCNRSKDGTAGDIITITVTIISTEIHLAAILVVGRVNDVHLTVQQHQAAAQREGGKVIGGEVAGTVQHQGIDRRPPDRTPEMAQKEM